MEADGEKGMKVTDITIKVWINAVVNGQEKTFDLNQLIPKFYERAYLMITIWHYSKTVFRERIELSKEQVRIHNKHIKG